MQRKKKPEGRSCHNATLEIVRKQFPVSSQCIACENKIVWERQSGNARLSLLFSYPFQQKYPSLNRNCFIVIKKIKENIQHLKVQFSEIDTVLVSSLQALIKSPFLVIVSPPLLVQKDPYDLFRPPGRKNRLQLKISSHS